MWCSHCQLFTILESDVQVQASAFMPTAFSDPARLLAIVPVSVHSRSSSSACSDLRPHRTSIYRLEDEIMMTKRAGGVLAAPLIHKRPRLSDASSETSTGPAAEVAADFRDSLADLSMNDRYQISTLTIIAKENTEHASAISDVLLNHIRTVSATILLNPDFTY